MKSKQVIDTSDRYAFGRNWARFLKHMNEERILAAEKSLLAYLNLSDLKNLTFIDVGSGSGLFSLAAYRLGAKVISFDYDQDSVSCTTYLKQKYTTNSQDWLILQGSVLDEGFLAELGQFDIVYSWGVLHHTGNMYQAFKNIASLVKEGGYLFISIYNDQGINSIIWKKIKKTYHNWPVLRPFLLLVSGISLGISRLIIAQLVRLSNPTKLVTNYTDANRGMSIFYDFLDWVGGYPFEVAKPDEIFNVFFAKKFLLIRIKIREGGLGCNEFVFKKSTAFLF